MGIFLSMPIAEHWSSDGHFLLLLLLIFNTSDCRADKALVHFGQETIITIQIGKVVVVSTIVWSLATNLEIF